MKIMLNFPYYPQLPAEGASSLQKRCHMLNVFKILFRDRSLIFVTRGNAVGISRAQR
jgi:hypothetical protein